MDQTQKNQGKPPEKRYDYSHLRDNSKQEHWYSTPNTVNSNPAVPPPPTVPANTPVIPPPTAPLPEGDPRGATRRRIDDRRRRKAGGMPENWAWVIIASALLGLTVIGSIFLIIVVRYTIRDNDDADAMSSAPLVEPTSAIFSGDSGQEVGGALEGNALEIQNRKWDGNERFTLLLMGLDKRPGEDGAYFRTDTMILISFDPQTNSIGMLSIPRDLYVEVPYEGIQRINSAYVLGELDAPGNGPRLAMQTVQYNFGIYVHDYVTVDFNTVIKIIDAIGGIDVEVPSEITDYSYPTMDYGTEVFHVDAGWQHLDGTTALKYARTRHASDDIDRARRQQQVIYSVRDRVTSLGMVDDLVLQAPMLYGEIKSGVNTGLSVDQLIALAIWASDVPRENIHSGVVGWEYLIGHTTESGANVLVPNRYLIGPLMVEVFGENYNATN